MCQGSDDFTLRTAACRNFHGTSEHMNPWKGYVADSISIIKETTA